MTRALVIGGGTGGLTTALWLHRVGVEVTVFEAVPEVKPLGVGINLLPHAPKCCTNSARRTVWRPPPS